MEMRIKFYMFIFSLILFTINDLAAKTRTYTIVGTICFQQQGAIYVMLLNEQEYTNKAGSKSLYRKKIVPSAEQILRSQLPLCFPSSAMANRR